MFHQVLVPEHDRRLLRFLWWDNQGCHFRLRDEGLFNLSKLIIKLLQICSEESSCGQQRKIRDCCCNNTTKTHLHE